jgi:hypothetical protein
MLLNLLLPWRKSRRNTKRIKMSGTFCSCLNYCIKMVNMPRIYSLNVCSIYRSV